VESLALWLEQVLCAHDAAGRTASVELRHRGDRYADVRLIFPDRDWLGSAAGQGLVQAFQDHPAVASAQCRRTAVSLRLTDEAVSRLGRRLAEDPAVMAASDLFRGRRVMVGFVGPNTCKALHVGHLRNVVLGQALAAAYETAGAEVSRESLVGDIGRRVCESMAGYALFYHGAEPGSAGLKGDELVGRCYADYLRQTAAPEDEPDLPDPNREERSLKGDYADELMRGWRRGDPEVRDLWRRLRSWVLEGHRATLERLGVTLDRLDFESTGAERAHELIREGLESGLFQRYRGEMVGYPTGRAEYSQLVLLREDGFPTEHTRLLAVYESLLTELHPDWTYLEVAGDEWQPSAAVLREILERLRPGPHNAVHVRVFHGMVTLDDAKISSSSGEPLLIEELYDRVMASGELAELTAPSAADRFALADVVVRSYFLATAAAKKLNFSWRAFLDGSSNPGWALARAWCRASSADRHGNAEDAEIEPAYRVAVLRSQGFRPVLERALERREVTGIFRFLRAFSETYLESPAGAKLDRAARTVLGTALASLGYVAGRTSR